MTSQSLKQHRYPQRLSHALNIPRLQSYPAGLLPFFQELLLRLGQSVPARLNLYGHPPPSKDPYQVGHTIHAYGATCIVPENKASMLSDEMLNRSH